MSENETKKVDIDLSSKPNDPGFWKEIWQQARLIYGLMLDPEVPTYLKLIPFGAIAYLLSPIDLIPDMMLGLGQLDDLTVLLVLSRAFINLAPGEAVARHRAAIKLQDGEDLETVVIDQEEN